MQAGAKKLKGGGEDEESVNAFGDQTFLEVAHRRGKTRSRVANEPKTMAS